jgi:hypothetical protein
VLPVPGAYARLVPLLRAIVEDMEAGRRMRRPSRTASSMPAGWACAMPKCCRSRWRRRQKLLEIEDSIDRLEIIYRFLEGKGLLPEA